MKEGAVVVRFGTSLMTEPQLEALKTIVKTKTGSRVARIFDRSRKDSSREIIEICASYRASAIEINGHLSPEDIRVILQATQIPVLQAVHSFEHETHDGRSFKVACFERYQELALEGENLAIKDYK